MKKMTMMMTLAAMMMLTGCYTRFQPSNQCLAAAQSEYRALVAVDRERQLAIDEMKNVGECASAKAAQFEELEGTAATEEQVLEFKHDCEAKSDEHDRLGDAAAASRDRSQMILETCKAEKDEHDFKQARRQHRMLVTAVVFGAYSAVKSR